MSLELFVRGLYTRTAVARSLSGRVSRTWVCGTWSKPDNHKSRLIISRLRRPDRSVLELEPVRVRD